MVAVVAAALVFWAAVFAVYFTSMTLTPWELVFGRHEPPPPDLGVWKETGARSPEGWVEEERRILPEGKPRAGYYIRQVRYRDGASRAILRVGPDAREKRARVNIRGQG